MPKSTKYRKNWGTNCEFADMPVGFQTVDNAWNIHAPWTAVVTPHVRTDEAPWDWNIEFKFTIDLGSPDASRSLKGNVHVRKTGNLKVCFAGHYWVEGIPGCDALVPQALVSRAKNDFLAQCV